MTYKFKANIFIFFFSRTRRKKPDCIYNTNGSSIINCCLTLSVVYREAFFLCNLIFLKESACVLLLLHQHLDMHKLHKFISFISSLARLLSHYRVLLKKMLWSHANTEFSPFFLSFKHAHLKKWMERVKVQWMQSSLTCSRKHYEVPRTHFLPRSRALAQGSNREIA